jgi:hypothetical protein
VWREVLFEEEVGGAATNPCANYCNGLHDVAASLKDGRPSVYFGESLTRYDPAKRPGVMFKEEEKSPSK